MLGSSFNIKLSDFGFAKLMDHELGPQKIGLVRNHGYLNSEYRSIYKATKSQMYIVLGMLH